MPHRSMQCCATLLVSCSSECQYFSNYFWATENSRIPHIVSDHADFKEPQITSLLQLLCCPKVLYFLVHLLRLYKTAYWDHQLLHNMHSLFIWVKQCLSVGMCLIETTFLCTFAMNIWLCGWVLDIELYTEVTGSVYRRLW